MGIFTPLVLGLLVGTRLINACLVLGLAVSPRLIGTPLVLGLLVGTRLIDACLVLGLAVSPRLIGTPLVFGLLVGTRLIDALLVLGLLVGTRLIDALLGLGLSGTPRIGDALGLHFEVLRRSTPSTGQELAVVEDELFPRKVAALVRIYANHVPLRDAYSRGFRPVQQAVLVGIGLTEDRADLLEGDSLALGLGAPNEDESEDDQLSGFLHGALLRAGFAHGVAKCEWHANRPGTPNPNPRAPEGAHVDRATPLRTLSVPRMGQ